MELIETVEQLKKNIVTFDNYLTKGTTEQKNWAKERISKGVCFVAYLVNNDTRFIPSRFVGYIDNDISKHNSSTTKHGRDTNRAIKRILKSKPETNNEKLLSQFFDFCGEIGIDKRECGLFEKKRKFGGKDWKYKMKQRKGA